MTGILHGCLISKVGLSDTSSELLNIIERIHNLQATHHLQPDSSNINRVHSIHQ